MAEVTTTQIINAIKTARFPKAIGTFIEIKPEAQVKYTPEELQKLSRGDMLPKNNKDVKAACAMGQAGLVLGIAPADLYPTDVSYGLSEPFFDRITEINDDNEEMPLVNIAARIQEWLNEAIQYEEDHRDEEDW